MTIAGGHIARSPARRAGACARRSAPSARERWCACRLRMRGRQRDRARGRRSTRRALKGSLGKGATSIAYQIRSMRRSSRSRERARRSGSTLCWLRRLRRRWGEAEQARLRVDIEGKPHAVAEERLVPTVTEALDHPAHDAHVLDDDGANVIAEEKRATIVCGDAGHCEAGAPSAPQDAGGTTLRSCDISSSTA